MMGEADNCPPPGTHKAVKIDGAWHVVALYRTGLFGLGPAQWMKASLIGRSQRRAEKKAERMTRRAMRRIDRLRRDQESRLTRRAEESAMIQAKLTQDRSN